MSWAILLVLLALVIGGFGLALETMRWLLIIALVLMAVGAFMGWARRKGGV